MNSKFRRDYSYSLTSLVAKRITSAGKVLRLDTSSAPMLYIRYSKVHKEYIFKDLLGRKKYIRVPKEIIDSFDIRMVGHIGYKATNKVSNPYYKLIKNIGKLAYYNCAEASWSRETEARTACQSTAKILVDYLLEEEYATSKEIKMMNLGLPVMHMDYIRGVL